MSVGTPKTGYVKAELGPFRCGHCRHFNPVEGCKQPEVVAEIGAQRAAAVTAGDCCNEYEPQERGLLAPHSSNVVLYVARHGTTILNQGHKFRGNIDVPLDDAGGEDAKELAELFSNVQLASILCSDTQRASATAGLIAGSTTGERPFQTPLLRSWNLGYLSGQPKSKENLRVLQHYVNNPATPVPQGESLSSFKQRVDKVYHSLLSRWAEGDLPTLVVAHSSVVRELGALVYGSADRVLVEPGGAAVAYFDDAGSLQAKPIFKPSNAKSELGYS